MNADSEIIGKVTLADLTITFTQNLIRVIASSKDSMLILTLTGKQTLYQKYREKIKNAGNYVDRIDENLREGVSRQAKFLTPLSREEVYDVIVKRLVESRNEKKVEEIADRYYNYYRDKYIVTDYNYKDKIKKAYPFHPFLLDILYERVSSIESFNKTRVALRLLALIAHNIIKNRIPLEIIGTDSIDFNNIDIKEELTSRIDRGDFKVVIESDCIEKAKMLDKDRNIKLVEATAKTIYLYSLIDATRPSGIKANELRLAVCRPGMDPSLVNKVLEEIDKEFWYLVSRDGEYYFDKKPNINKIINDYKKEVSEQEVRDKIREVLKELVKSDQFTPYIWDFNAMPDDEDLKLFVVDYNEHIDDSTFDDMLKHMPNQGFRKYQNTIVFLYPEQIIIDELKDTAKKVLATKNALNNESVKADKEIEKKAKTMLDEFKTELKVKCMNAYSHIAYPHSNINNCRLSTTHASNLIDVIIEMLKNNEKLVDTLSPFVIDDILNYVDKIEDAQVKNLYERFKMDRSKPFINKGILVVNAIKKGVENGIFGYASKLEEKDGKYRAIIIGKSIEISWEGYVIRKDLILEEEEKPIEIPKQPYTHKIEEEAKVTPKITKYHYIFKRESIDDLIRTITPIPILALSNVKDSLYAVLMNDKGDKITIESNLSNIDEMKSILNQFKGRGYRGGGYVEIESDEDISHELENLKLSPYEMK